MIIGLKELERDIERLGINFEAGLHDAATNILSRSQKLVPINKNEKAVTRGQLMASGSIDRVKGGYAIGYQAFNKGYDYAPIQHEHMGYTHLPGRTAKYLEDAVDLKEIEKLAVRRLFR